MFTNGMKESSQHEIHLDERGETIDSDAFEALINFAYSGKVSISTSNVQSLMMTASFLQLSRVRDACAEFLMARLSPNNVLGIKSFADSLGCSILVAACHKFVKKFFAKVRRHKLFWYIDIYQICILHDGKCNPACLRKIYYIALKVKKLKVRIYKSPTFFFTPKYLALMRLFYWNFRQLSLSILK